MRECCESRSIDRNLLTGVTAGSAVPILSALMQNLEKSMRYCTPRERRKAAWNTEPRHGSQEVQRRLTCRDYE